MALHDVTPPRTMAPHCHNCRHAQAKGNNVRRCALRAEFVSSWDKCDRHEWPARTFWNDVTRKYERGE